MRKVLVAISLVGTLAGLSACGSRGVFNRDRPDEMAVTRQAPLVVPPDFNLTPPQPGAPRPAQDTASQQALEALFGGPAPRSGVETSALDKAGLSALKIEPTLSPPWSTDWISAEGREKLRAYGIAPPVKTQVQCPRCGSAHTEELSRFGSTPCKSLHRCLDCREPFDRFKCH